MPRTVSIDEARRAYAAREWGRAFECYAAQPHLDEGDLDRYAQSAMLLGRMDDYYAIRERAYDERIAAGDVQGAALAAFWAGMQRMADGDVAAGGGWLARSARLVTEDGTDSLVAGYQLLADGFAAISADEADRAVELFDRSLAAGRRLDSADLVALALHLQGRALIRAGRTEEGLARLDEALVEVTGGRPSPMVTGIVYCGALSGCWTAYELGRAQQWTTAMTDWCRTQPDLGNFTGECKVRRAELKVLHGEWADADAELAGVRGEPDAWAASRALYVRGDLARLRGDSETAEEAFNAASRLGSDPQPGLALLRLAKGNVQAAAAMARRSVAEAGGEDKRVEVLVGAVEILLAVDDVEAAAAAVTQLREQAQKSRTKVVTALAAHASAALELAGGRPEAALPPAREALLHWVHIRAPYQEARTRLVIADACRLLGDAESAERELVAARDLLAGLGAAADLARLPGADNLLSPREVEVLRLVATGATNRAIATKLVLSERTVDRHVSNILAKLRVSTRAAATAYAFEHQIL